MNSKFTNTVAVVTLLSTLSPQLSTVFAQGSLTPPGAPAPTMKSLDQVESRTPVSSLPFTIAAAGSYYLTTNLIQSSGVSGITIQANNVSLDLNGFALIGAFSAGTAITNPTSQRSLRIYNGKIENWFGGSVALNSSTTGTVLEDLQCRGNVSSPATNVILNEQSRMSRCIIVRANGVGASIGDRCLIEDCQFMVNGGGGIVVGDQCQVLNCIVKQNTGGPGITTGDHCILRGNVVSGNASGVSMLSGGTILENTIENNNFGAAGQFGVLLNGRHNRVENNVIQFNGSFGITNIPGATNNLIIRNFVVTHSSTNFAFVGGQVFGPIVNTVGMITTNNPWANFSY